MTLITTKRLLREHGACRAGYAGLLRHLRTLGTYRQDTPIPLTVVLDSNSLEDTLWCLRAVPPEQAAERDRIARWYAADEAESVLHLWEARYPRDYIPHVAISTARRHALGLATDTELAAVRDNAWAAAAWSAVRDNAWDAAWAAAVEAGSGEESAHRLRVLLEHPDWAGLPPLR